MVENLGLIASWLLQQFDSIWGLYAAGTVLAFPIVLWILDRLFNIFDILKR